MRMSMRLCCAKPGLFISFALGQNAWNTAADCARLRHFFQITQASAAFPAFLAHIGSDNLHVELVFINDGGRGTFLGRFFRFAHEAQLLRAV